MKEKYKLFALEYLANGYCALDAYRKIYPNAAQSTVNSHAYRILKMPEVAAFIEEERKLIFESKMVDATRWAEEVASIAFAQKGDITYTTADKLKALQMIQKYLGLDVQKVETKQEVIEVNMIED